MALETNYAVFGVDADGETFPARIDGSGAVNITLEQARRAVGLNRKRKPTGLGWTTWSVYRAREGGWEQL